MTKDEALRLAKEALTETGVVDTWCPWCENDIFEEGHAPKCLRQRALAAIDAALGTPPSYTPKAS